MMPLWMMASEPSEHMWGCALRSTGMPWVAQRVCPMPDVARVVFTLSSLVSRFTSLPSARTVVSCLFWMNATPAESYPRYSRRRKPSTISGTAGLCPVYPMMPHIYHAPYIRPESALHVIYAALPTDFGTAVQAGEERNIREVTKMVCVRAAQGVAGTVSCVISPAASLPCTIRQCRSAGGIFSEIRACA